MLQVTKLNAKASALTAQLEQATAAIQNGTEGTAALQQQLAETEADAAEAQHATKVRALAH